MDESLMELSEQELKAFWRTSCQKGAEYLTAAQRIIRDYALQEKEKGYRLTDSAKIGIYAYHYNYAEQGLERLEKLPPEQKTLGNELKDIQVSTDFVQSMAPQMSEWERLHYFQYGTTIHDLSGKPIEMVKVSLGVISLTAWMGLTHRKFKEQANLFERFFSAPIMMPQVGPLMAYRKFGKRGLQYYYFNPNDCTSHTRE